MHSSSIEPPHKKKKKKKKGREGRSKPGQSGASRRGRRTDRENPSIHPSIRLYKQNVRLQDVYHVSTNARKFVPPPRYALYMLCLQNSLLYSSIVYRQFFNIFVSLKVSQVRAFFRMRERKHAHTQYTCVGRAQEGGRGGDRKEKIISSPGENLQHHRPNPLPSSLLADKTLLFIRLRSYN